MSQKTILLLTGGGETSVLNATLYGAVSEARKRGMRVLGSICGWAGIIDGSIVDLTTYDLEGIQQIGGTFLRTSRTNPFSTPGGISALKQSMREHAIDSILAIGGDDTLGAALKLYAQEGIPVVGAPKTADNDLNGTYYCPGFPSAAYHLSSLVNQIKRDCALPRHRLFLIESQGGNAGWLPSAGILGNADLITVPEHEVKLSRLAGRAKEIMSKQHHGVFVISKETRFDVQLGEVEKQTDGFAVRRTRHICVGLQEMLEKDFGIHCQVITPANLIRSGRGHDVDISLAIKIGIHAVSLIASGTYGEMACIDSDGSDLFVSSRPLSAAAGKDNYRALPGSYYDQASLLPTPAYRKYLTSILGTVGWGDDWYYTLMEQTYTGSDRRPS